jgi:hypothetical protein
MRALTIIKENPGRDLGRARAKYFSFDWHQSYEQNSNIGVAAQVRP